jgi:hypothetical protein
MRNLRLEADHVTDTVAFIADRSANLADRVDELNAEHPLGRGQFNLPSEIMNVLNKRTQDHASALGGVGAHAIDDRGGEVGVELACGRHSV